MLFSRKGANGKDGFFLDWKKKTKNPPHHFLLLAVASCKYILALRSEQSLTQSSLTFSISHEVGALKKLSWKFSAIKKRCLSHHSSSLSHINVKKSAVLFFFRMDNLQGGRKCFCVWNCVPSLLDIPLRTDTEPYHLRTDQTGVTSLRVLLKTLRTCFLKAWAQG